MRRICSQAIVTCVLAAIPGVVALASDDATAPLESLTIETPGLPPVTVFVGEAQQAARAADQQAAAIAAQLQTERLADALRAFTPDYPADAPEIAAALVIPAPPPVPVADVAPEVAPVIATPSATAVGAALKSFLAQPNGPVHPRLTRSQRDEISAFYAARDFRPLWNHDAGLTDRGEAVLKTLLSAGSDGLDASAYAIAKPDAAADAAARAIIEFQLSQAVVLYARDSQGGRIDAKRLSNLIDPEITLSPVDDILAQLADATQPGDKLQSYNPPHAGYRALRSQLARLRAAHANLPHMDAVTVSDGSEETRLTSPAGKRRKAVALAEAASAGEADIIANMERWRWLPRDLGDKHVFVNIPEYRVRVVEAGAVAHEARVIVGKPDSPTPIFSDRMQFLVVNPSWFVPPSILKKEFLPKLAQDPTYAERRGYQVIRRGNQIYVRQPPGERNALGHIKFMFPNRHAVYLHDTPSRGLFSAERRAFSHGCVRVDQPFRLAEMVLGRDNGWSEQRVRGLVGRGEQSVKLSAPLPVHLAYFTTFVDEMGRLETRDDIYGYHRRVKAALGLDLRM